jgi:pimeloyl-ACP methyl ester carboxylesterase
LKHLTLDSYQKQAQYTKLCGHRIAYWQSALFHQNTNKPTLLFIHGFPSASWDWHFQWKHLANDYRLICLDLLGFGLSAKPKEHRYSLLEQADIIEALLAEQGIEQYHILAHDYGDSVAQELLSRTLTSEAKVQSICFLNGGLFASHHRPLFTQKLLKSPLGNIVIRFMSKATLAKGFKKIFAPDKPPKEYELDILWQLLEHNQGIGVLPKLLGYIDERKEQGKRWTQSMISTSIPLCFINGVLDPISGQHMLNHYIDIIPNPKWHAIDVGHYPQLEAPERVLCLYREFLNGQLD